MGSDARASVDGICLPGFLLVFPPYIALSFYESLQNRFTSVSHCVQRVMYKDQFT